MENGTFLCLNNHCEGVDIKIEICTYMALRRYIAGETLIEDCTVHLNPQRPLVPMPYRPPSRVAVIQLLASNHVSELAMLWSSRSATLNLLSASYRQCTPGRSRLSPNMYFPRIWL